MQELVDYNVTEKRTVSKMTADTIATLAAPGGSRGERAVFSGQLLAAGCYLYFGRLRGVCPGALGGVGLGSLVEGGE